MHRTFRGERGTQSCLLGEWSPAASYRRLLWLPGGSIPSPATECNANGQKRRNGCRITMQPKKGTSRSFIHGRAARPARPALPRRAPIAPPPPPLPPPPPAAHRAPPGPPTCTHWHPAAWLLLLLRCAAPAPAARASPQLPASKKGRGWAGAQGSGEGAQQAERGQLAGPAQMRAGGAQPICRPAAASTSRRDSVQIRGGLASGAGVLVSESLSLASLAGCLPAVRPWGASAAALPRQRGGGSSTAVAGEATGGGRAGRVRADCRAAFYDTGRRLQPVKGALSCTNGRRSQQGQRGGARSSTREGSKQPALYG